MHFNALEQRRIGGAYNSKNEGNLKVFTFSFVTVFICIYERIAFGKIFTTQHKVKE